MLQAPKFIAAMGRRISFAVSLQIASIRQRPDASVVLLLLPERQSVPLG